MPAMPVEVEEFVLDVVDPVVVVVGEPVVVVLPVVVVVPPPAPPVPSSSPQAAAPTANRAVIAKPGTNERMQVSLSGFIR
jgi:hypothetical protein